MSQYKLVHVYLLQERLRGVRERLPELPWETRKRLKDSYGLSDRDIEVLLNVDSACDVQHDGGPAKTAVAYFDGLCAEHGAKVRDPKVVVNW